MVFTDQASRIIIENYPGFLKSRYWEDYLESYPDGGGSMCSIMMQFTGYVEDLLNADTLAGDTLESIFNCIETLMVEGDQGVKDGVATCFLENLINLSSWGTVRASSFIHYLGVESKKYCKAWDEFTGVKTEGLWD